MHIGLTSPEDIMYDNSYTKDFLDWLDSLKSNDTNTVDEYDIHSKRQ